MSEINAISLECVANMLNKIEEYINDTALDDTAKLYRVRCLIEGIQAAYGLN